MDLSDIKTTKSKADPVATPLVGEGAEVKVALSGYIVAIGPDKEGKYSSKDIAELTGKEFIDWAKGVYPMEPQSDKDIELFNGRAPKIRALENIIRFHEQGLMTSKRNSGKELIN